MHSFIAHGTLHIGGCPTPPTDSSSSAFGHELHEAVPDHFLLFPHKSYPSLPRLPRLHPLSSFQNLVCSSPRCEFAGTRSVQTSNNSQSIPDMVSKEYSPNSLHHFSTQAINSPSDTFLPTSSSSQRTGSIMSSEMPPPVHVSPYGPPAQGNSHGQPYLPQPAQGQGQGQEHQEGQTSNQYPQYSYDIRLRYPQDPSSRSSYPPPLAHSQGTQLPPMAVSPQDNGDYAAQSMNMDMTGQIAPIGVKPRVTATLWEDEGTLCFQVDVKGTCVARREDNHMVNGTKLLNVAGMTRGRRDGILKSEKQKHVVKIGPMHLKGVWIPFERALEFANKEKITEMLYPLFVHNIGALLYHPINGGYPGAAQIPRSPGLPQPNMTGMGGQGVMGPGSPPVPAGQRMEGY
ncbi:hypothetical protein BKA65DRAFT_501222 [Rhexocercosporidium sp. MPI-PUGE-AT-0058]|nr:hypothetical protein BKA65DRAFT_501222 [Rhexocercosporidium sp. MPI-PUGE-AT-0058]